MCCHYWKFVVYSYSKTNREVIINIKRKKKKVLTSFRLCDKILFVLTKEHISPEIQGSNLLREAKSKTHPPFRSREQITPFNATVYLYIMMAAKIPLRGH